MRTKDVGITYKKRAEMRIDGFSDADYAGDKESRKSTTGVVVFLGGAPIVWKSRLQRVVALSTTEAELLAGVEVCKEVIWLKKLFVDMNVKLGEVNVHIDNQGTLKTLENPALHMKTKHVDIRLKYLRQLYREEAVVFKYCKTEDQAADGLTKSLSGEKFRKFVKDMMN